MGNAMTQFHGREDGVPQVPIRAIWMLLWSQWRQTGWYGFAGLLITALLVGMIHVTPAGREYDVSMFVLTMGARLAALLTLVTVIATSLFMHMNKDRLGFGFARHLCILPMRTGTLVVLQFGYSLALVTVLVVCFRLLFGSIPDTKNLEFEVADAFVFRPVVWVVIVAMLYGGMWSLGALKSAAMGLPFLFIFAAAIAGTIEASWFAYCAAVAGLAGVAAVYPSRKGQALRIGWPNVLGGRDRDRGKFASPEAAQAWFERRSRGSWLYAIHGVCVLVAAVFVVMEDRGGLAGAWKNNGLLEFVHNAAAGLAFGAFPFAVLIYGLILFTREVTLSRRKEGLWLFTRPMATRQLAQARLRSNGRQFALHAAALLLLLLPFAYEATTEIAVVIDRPWMDDLPGGPLLAASGLLALIVAGAGVLAWSAQFHLASVGVGIFVWQMPLSMLIFARGGPDVRFQERNEALVRAVETGSALFLWVCVLALVFMAARRGFIGLRQIVFMVLTWGIAMVFLRVFFSAELYNDLVIHGHWWLYAGLVAFAPALATVIVPLNLHWQRHK